MWKILFYEDHRGKSPVLDFINSLNAKDRAKVNNAFRLLEEFGVKLNMPHARHIQGKLWELRPGANRLFYFIYIDDQIILLHGYRKRSQKAPAREIATALQYMQKIMEE
jgi:phage-related protein